MIFINDVSGCFMYELFLIFADDLKLFYKVVTDIDFLNMQSNFNRFAEMVRLKRFIAKHRKMQGSNIFEENVLIHSMTTALEINNWRE